MKAVTLTLPNGLPAKGFEQNGLAVLKLDAKTWAAVHVRSMKALFPIPAKTQERPKAVLTNLTFFMDWDVNDASGPEFLERAREVARSM